ncbi:MAG: putative toxin-antitoxin system toxin component, PIN family [Bacteroidota bacterium]
MDTNVLLMSIPKKSPYRRIFDALIDGECKLAITNEILSEYMEVLEEKASSIVAKNIGEFLVNSRYVQKVEIFYRWNLIEQDPDDNKFVDCAIAGNVKFIVSNDSHFKILKTIDFPNVEVIKIDDFLKELS